jgi:putative ATP-dependent endonuclease of OLD family
LSKEGKEIFVSQASSGEKELINFILGILALNSKNGIVLIDEPELHIHSTWQKALIEMLVELSNITLNQLFITTHSPNFINEKILDKVFRIYIDINLSSNVVQSKEKTGKLKDLIHIVNNYNNERMFFADKVILVEGIQDKIFFENYIRLYLKALKITKTYEVLEVGGKHNFEKYKEFLKEFEIETYIIADQDYLDSVIDSPIKDLFQTNYRKINSKIKEKKSKDADGLIESLIKYLDNNDTENINSTLSYLESKYVKLRNNLSEAENERLNQYIQKLQNDKIFVLPKGSIEYYLPNGYKALETMLALVKDENFIPWLKNNRSDELDNIIFKILNIDINKRQELLAKL